MAELVSICIPTYKRTKFLRESLASCLTQTHSHLEVIVHDDTEDDSIRSIVEGLQSPNLRYLQNKPALGVVAKLNNFLSIAKGRYAVIVADDDLIDSRFIEVMLNHASAYPDVNLFRCRYKLIDAFSRVIRLDNGTKFLSTASEFIRDLFAIDEKAFKSNISGVFFNVSTLTSVGGFHNLYRGYQTDKLAWAQLAAHGGAIFEPSPLCSLRLHTDSLAMQADEDLMSSLEAETIARDEVLRLLDRLSEQALTPVEQLNLRAARENVKSYYFAYISLRFDRAYFRALQLETKIAHERTKQIRELMRRFGSPIFKSYIAYRVLEHIPLSYRARVLTFLADYKLSKYER